MLRTATRAALVAVTMVIAFLVFLVITSEARAQQGGIFTCVMPDNSHAPCYGAYLDVDRGAPRMCVMLDHSRKPCYGTWETGYARYPRPYGTPSMPSVTECRRIGIKTYCTTR